MQCVWVSKIAWHDPLPADIKQVWSRFLEELPNIADISIPSFYCVSAVKSCQLCGFCDASERGYAAIVYLRVTLSSSEVKMF